MVVQQDKQARDLQAFVKNAEQGYSQREHATDEILKARMESYQPSDRVSRYLPINTEDYRVTDSERKQHVKSFVRGGILGGGLGATAALTMAAGAGGPVTAGLVLGGTIGGLLTQLSMRHGDIGPLDGDLPPEIKQSYMPAKEHHKHGGFM